jgi:hypothetical protein
MRAIPVVASPCWASAQPWRIETPLERHDRRVKLPAYRQIETVQEIALVASGDLYAEVHRRAGAQWITEILRGGESVLSLASVPIDIRPSDLYEGMALVDAESNSAAEA